MVIEENQKPKVKRKRRHMRLPNGFGSITELRNRRLRKPFLVRITVGKDENGRPITKALKPVSYFATYNEAYTALVKYNEDPYDVSDVITVQELYDRWSEYYFEKVSPSSVRTVKSAWEYSKSLASIPVRELKSKNLKSIIENSPSENLARRIKSLFNIMLDYAVEYEIVTTNVARTFSLEAPNKESDKHKSFTDDELELLWKYKADPVVQMILVGCYTGFRPQELCTIKRENIDVNQRIMIGGSKTDAGRNRHVPIHEKIISFVGSMENMTYDRYSYRFHKTLAEIGISDHTPHDTRKTFVTRAKKYKLDEYAIKRIVGHAITDITEKIYTERSDEWLISEIEKMH